MTQIAVKAVNPPAGLAGPTEEDYVRAGIDPAELSHLANAELAASDWLTAVLKELAAEGLKLLADWLKNWATTSETHYHGTNQFYSKAGERLHLHVSNVDDEATLWLNDKLLQTLHHGDAGTWVISDRVRKGANFLITAVDNHGRLGVSADVSIYGARTNKAIPGASFTFSGNDGLAPNRHLILTRFIGT